MSALSWGAGDFCGGLASRRTSVVSAILASQVVGFVGTAVLLGLSAEQLPSVAALGWSLVAGLSGVTGLGAFYLTLSRGTMGLIAPLTGLIGAALPALIGILGGEELGEFRLLGILAALVAVLLISLPTSDAHTPAERRAVRLDVRDLPLVAISGLGFAGFFIFLDLAAREGGQTWWPITVVRFAGLCLIAAAIVFLLARAARLPLRERAARLFRLPGRNEPRSLLSIGPLLLVAGAGDLGGNLFFVLANAADLLSVSVVLSSLYPVVTTMLAVFVLGERLRPSQLAGIGLAVVAVALIGR